MAEKKNNGYNSLYERFGVLKDLTLKEEDRYPAVNRAAAMSRSIPSSPVVEPIKADTTLTPPAPATPSAPKSSNILNQLPVNKEDTYWGQNVGKTNIPLDKFVQMAGMFSRMLNPEDPGGIGKELTQMGGAASAGRAQREYDAPNELLRRRLLTAQTEEAESAGPLRNILLGQGAVKGESEIDLIKERIRASENPTAEWPTFLKAYLADPVNAGKNAVNARGEFYKIVEEAKAAAKVPKGVVREMKNPDFNPNKSDSVTNPRHIKRVVADTELGGTVPIVDEFTKAGVKATEKKAATDRAKEGLQINKGRLKVAQDSLALRREVEKRMAAGKSATPDFMLKLEKEIAVNYTDPDTLYAVDMFNANSKTDAYVWQEVEVDVDRELMDPTTWTGGIEQQMQWVKIPKQATQKIPQYTEVDLRARLTEQKKSDPGIDIEKAMKTYKSKGLY